jgi:hypothetical protein
MVEPMDFLMTQTALEMQTYAIGGFAQQLVYENVDDYSWTPLEQTGAPRQSPAGSWDRSTRFLSLGFLLTQTLQDMLSFRGFESTSLTILDTQTILFHVMSAETFSECSSLHVVAFAGPNWPTAIQWLVKYA